MCRNRETRQTIITPIIDEMPWAKSHANQPNRLWKYLEMSFYTYLKDDVL